MSLLKSAVKYKTAKSVTNKVVGDGLLSSVIAADMVKKSNARGKRKKAERRSTGR
ncbi:hypothetical protein [Enterococcus sp. AZ126]|uniref:hypothetical protein n=1 Tax=Enterococcus sp. AZ126 TaxID=2774635 RepID=UPI003F244E07